MVPPPGLVPPVMLYCVWPLGRVIGADTWVFNPDGVIGGAAVAADTDRANARKRDGPDIRY